MGIFEYARLKLYINEILNGTGDVANRRPLKPLPRDSILRDAVHAFQPGRTRREAVRHRSHRLSNRVVSHSQSASCPCNFST